MTIGQQVKSTKFGIGEITKIITKSTGYCEVTYAIGMKKEMLYNLTDINGNSLKSKPKQSKPTEKQIMYNRAKSNYAALAELHCENKIQYMKSAGIINNDYSYNN